MIHTKRLSMEAEFDDDERTWEPTEDYPKKKIGRTTTGRSCIPMVWMTANISTTEMSLGI